MQKITVFVRKNKIGVRAPKKLGQRMSEEDLSGSG